MHSPTPPLPFNTCSEPNYAQKLESISSAQDRCGFARTDFFRFRAKHKIQSQPGRRIVTDDIVEAFEAERLGRRRDPRAAGTRTLPLPYAEYLKKILPLAQAMNTYGFMGIGFWRFRREHGIHKLSGQRVHEDDIVAAFEAKRRGTTLRLLRARAGIAA